MHKWKAWLLTIVGATFTLSSAAQGVSPRSTGDSRENSETLSGSRAYWSMTTNINGSHVFTLLPQKAKVPYDVTQIVVNLTNCNTNLVPVIALESHGLDIPMDVQGQMSLSQNGAPAGGFPDFSATYSPAIWLDNSNGISIRVQLNNKNKTCSARVGVWANAASLGGR
jgi:hypothetical protein